jgi:patatin-like phospholipase/acyl hydrolase
MTIKNIVLSGGAYKGFYTIGALKYLSENNFYNIEEIEKMYGTSVGSLLGALLCLKLNWEDLIEYAINKPWHKSFTFSIDTLLETISKKGFIQRKFIEGIFENLLKGAGLNTKSTLLDLFNHSNIELNIFSVNMSEFKLERFSYKTKPEMAVIDAVYRSCSMPFIFQPQYVGKDCYVDGGLINPYPMNICLEDLKKENPKFDNKEILGFKIVDDTLEPTKETASIFQFGFYMIYRLIKENYNYVCNENIPYELIIPSNLLSVSDAQNIVTSTSERRNLIHEGEKYAKLFITYLKA